MDGPSEGFGDIGFRAPVVEQPVVEQPVVEQPVVEQPVVEQPVVEQPVADQAAAEQPVADQVDSDGPTVTMSRYGRLIKPVRNCRTKLLRTNIFSEL